MPVADLFTNESIRAYQELYEATAESGRRAFEEYRRDREAQLECFPELEQWITSLEKGCLRSAAAPALWSALTAQGFVTCQLPNSIRGHDAVFNVEVISPKILDVSRDYGETKIKYAFTKVQVCLRAENVVPPGIALPDGLLDAKLVDTEIFEIPPSVTQDNLDDREIIHLIYLCGLSNGDFVCKPVYIGVGTGEAYGVGPRSRATSGRFRFYRYDIKNNYHLEYISRNDRTPWVVYDARDLPEVTSITDESATLLLGTNNADSGFMCLSDPKIAEGYKLWLRHFPNNRLIFKEIILERVRNDLRTSRPSTPFSPDDVAAVLNHAWNIHRFFFVAWQHPSRLSDQQGLDLYYPKLPAFRRREYEIYRFRPELFGMALGPEADLLTIPHVLWTTDLRRRLETAQPGAVARVEKWLNREVVEDMYSYGNHAEIRLCTAIALWQRLSDNGLWNKAVEAAYKGRLYEMNFSSESLCSTGD